IGVAALPPPQAEHDGEGPDGQQRAGIAADKPDDIAGEPGGLGQNSLGNVDIDGETAAGRQGIGGRKADVAAIDLAGCVLAARAEEAGEGLRLDLSDNALSDNGLSGGGAGQGDEGRGLVDGHLPVIAGDVPVELVVVLKKAHSVGGAVGDVYGALGVGASGVDSQDEELVVGAVGDGLGASALLEADVLAAFIGDRFDLEKKLVGGAIRARILDRNVALDAVVSALKRGMNL